jgi:hypothetical protein
MNCGLPAHSPNAQTPGSVVSSRSLTLYSPSHPARCQHPQVLYPLCSGCARPRQGYGLPQSCAPGPRGRPVLAPFHRKRRSPSIPAPGAAPRCLRRGRVQGVLPRYPDPRAEQVRSSLNHGDLAAEALHRLFWTFHIIPQNPIAENWPISRIVQERSWRTRAKRWNGTRRSTDAGLGSRCVLFNANR